MADISQYLQAIMSAIYGEDVRGSIHDAISIINDVSEVVLSTGTAVTGPTSSSTGFFEDSLYLNTSTWELWKCIGVDSWASQGIIKGDKGDPGDDGTIWYRGTGISGKAVNPTVYSGSGVADANAGDLYLNPQEAAVYVCVLGGTPTVATWSYEFTFGASAGVDAVDVAYDNTTSGLTATNVQNAIDEVDSAVDTLDTNKADTTDLDEWITGNGTTTGVVLSGSPNYIDFMGIDDSNNDGYKPYIQITDNSVNKNPTAQISTISGAGTSVMSIKYTTNADVGAIVKLRRIK